MQWCGDGKAGGVPPGTGGSQLLPLPCLPLRPAPFYPAAFALVARVQSELSAASRRHSWGSGTTGWGSMGAGPGPAGLSTWGTESCDLGGGCGEFIAHRLPLPRRGGRLMVAPWFPFQRTGEGLRETLGTPGRACQCWVFP